LAGGVIVTFLLMMRDLRTLRAMADPVAISLFLVIAAPWHVLASLKQDGFAWFYFINEHCLRFLGMREPRDYHTGPFYYYLSKLSMLLLPWTPFLGLLIDFSNKQDRAKQTLIRFCQAWVLFPLLFFSLSVAKSEYYLVLIAPAGALWLGLALEHHLQKEDDGMLSHCMGLALALCTAAFLALLFASPSQWLSLENMPLWWPICCVAAWALGARMMVISRGGGWMRDAVLASVGLAMIPILILVLRTADAKSERTSSRHIGELISGQGNIKPAVFVYRNFEDAFASLPFFLRDTVKVIDSQSRDLQFGCRASPDYGSACISSMQFSQYLKNRPIAVAVLDKHVQSFRADFGEYPWRSERRGDKWVFFNY